MRKKLLLRCDLCGEAMINCPAGDNWLCTDEKCSNGLGVPLSPAIWQRLYIPPESTRKN